MTAAPRGRARRGEVEVGVAADLDLERPDPYSLRHRDGFLRHRGGSPKLTMCATATRARSRRAASSTAARELPQEVPEREVDRASRHWFAAAASHRSARRSAPPPGVDPPSAGPNRCGSRPRSTPASRRTCTAGAAPRRGRSRRRPRARGRARCRPARRARGEARRAAVGQRVGDRLDLGDAHRGQAGRDVPAEQVEGLPVITSPSIRERGLARHRPERAAVEQQRLARPVTRSTT